MSNEIATTEAPAVWIKSSTALERLASIAPADFDVDRFAQAVLTSIAKIPALAKCNPASFATCALECAQLGLMPGAAGHAYLIPRGRDCTVQAGYKGLLHAVRKSVPGIFIDAHHVYAGDECDLIIGERPRHKLSLKSRGESLGVYATACEPGSDKWHTEWMPRDELEAHRKQYGGGGNHGPWKTATAEMERKTVLRRLCKTLPNMPLVDQMLAVEDDAIDFDAAPQVIDATKGEGSEYAYELLGRIDDLGNVDRADEAKAKILSLINAGASDDEVRAVCGQIVIWIERLESQPAREVVIDATEAGS